MPKREDEYWAGMKEPKGRGLCPFCGSSNISYNKRFHSWRCNKCEHSFPIPSYGPGGGFGKEARWVGKTTEEERRAEFAEAARKARAAKGKESGRSESGYPFDPDHVGYYRGEHSSKREKSRGPRGKKGVPGCLIFLIVVFSIAMLAFGVYNLYKANNPETTEYVDTTDTSGTIDTSDTGEQTSEDNGGEQSNIIGDYYLGLVYTPEGVLGGSECYGEFIVLINNEKAVDPSYNQLITFLQQDRTDQFPYQYTLDVLEFYYGTAESRIDLEYINDIISGISQPSAPRICADFAERLHNEAEMAGIRCAYVSVDLSGVGHALNAFQTTDRGLIYIDDTGVGGYGPSNRDKTVDVQVGQQYIPISLFSDPGWYDTWGDMGTVTDILITWDGEWKE
jgi:ribosomal protein L37AE/L43A